MSYTIKTGANSPALVVELYDNYGTPQQSLVTGLADALSITFIFKHSLKKEGDPPDLRNPGSYWADPADAARDTGSVQYDWAETDTATIGALGAGDINFEVDVEWAAGKVETFPSTGYFVLTVEDDLD